MMAVHAAQKLPDEKSSLSARMASAVAAGVVAIDGGGPGGGSDGALGSAVFTSWVWQWYQYAATSAVAGTATHGDDGGGKFIEEKSDSPNPRAGWSPWLFTPSKVLFTSAPNKYVGLDGPHNHVGLDGPHNHV